MSGYPHDVLSRYGLSGTDVPLLRKPFNEADLSRRVREALDEPAAAGFAASADGGPGPQGPSGGGPPPPDGR
jgi:hypothetical protein